MAKKTDSRHFARIVKIVKFKLLQLPDITAYLDTGYSKNETINIIRTMYKKMDPVKLETWDWMCACLVWEAEDKDSDYIEQNKTVIRFSYNWNNKLGCHAFTTIRLFAPKYQEGQVYKIEWKGNELAGLQGNLFTS